MCRDYNFNVVILNLSAKFFDCNNSKVVRMFETSFSEELNAAIKPWLSWMVQFVGSNPSGSKFHRDDSVGNLDAFMS